MIMQHLKDEDIQLYASALQEQGPTVAQHLADCEDCRRRLSEYQLLFSGLQELPAPAFTFDVAALVIPQLPVAAPQPVRERSGNYWTVILACAFILIPVIIFRAYLVNLVATPPAVLIYPMILAPVLLIIGKGYAMYRAYRKKIEMLNIY